LPSQANKTVPVVFSLVNQSGRLVLLQADSEQEAVIEASLAQSKRRQRNYINQKSLRVIRTFKRSFK